MLDAEGNPLDVRLDPSGQEMDGSAGPVRLILTDISMFKEAHRNLLDAHSLQEWQIGEQVTRVRTLNQELEQVVLTYNQQLHVPLARAMNFLQLTRGALAGPPEAATQGLLNTERALQQLIALVATVDRYMQVRSMRVRMRPVDLDSVLREVLKAAQPLMADRNVRITHAPLPRVQGDHRALYVVLDEYIGNALKFTKEREEARIHLSVRETEFEVMIGVEDNGAGFNMRQKDRLFQLFGRLHPSAQYEGTGIGLMTARRACERFGAGCGPRARSVRAPPSGSPGPNSLACRSRPSGTPQLPLPGSGSSHPGRSPGLNQSAFFRHLLQAPAPVTGPRPLLMGTPQNSQDPTDVRS